MEHAPTNGAGAFFEAVKGGDCARVKRLLLEAKVDGSQRAEDEGYQTAVHLAAAGNQVEVLKLLLEELKTGGDLEDRDSTSSTALQLAARGGHVEALKLLISLGADCNASADFRLQSPLLRAAEAGSVECVRELVEAAADVTARDVFDESIIFYAARAPTDQVLQYLLQQDIVPFDATCNSSALHEAARHGRTANLLLLIQQKVSVNVDCGGTLPTPFFAACAAPTSKANVECVKALVAARANTEIKNKRSETPLHWAAFRGNTSIVRFLCEHGIGGDINGVASDDEGLATPLHRALAAADHGAVRVLLEMRANVHAKSSQVGRG